MPFEVGTTVSDRPLSIHGQVCIEIALVSTTPYLQLAFSLGHSPSPRMFPCGPLRTYCVHLSAPAGPTVEGFVSGISYPLQ